MKCFICQNQLVKCDLQSFKHANITEFACYDDNGDSHCRQYTNAITGATIYYVIRLENFYIYYYCDNDTPESSVNPKNKVYVYHNNFPRGEGVQSPFLILQSSKVDLYKIVSYNHKWKILNTFS